MVLPRPRIDLSDEEQQRVREYADEHGLRMPRAYADLVRAGLEAENG
ncbi:hypothetical protein [Haladaptatus halobius]|nr:hypothetical protein [Haladaptatus halobius]